MHWLIRRSVESFLRDTYGDATWQALWRVSDGGKDGSPQNDPQGLIMLTDAARHLEKLIEDLLEDLGAWIARQERIRRLLRFSGRSFGEFLENLEQLPDRVNLVVPDLAIPPIKIVLAKNDFLQISLDEKHSEWSYVLAGLIRVMADDYGVLGLISVDATKVNVQVCDGSFSEKRSFQLVWDDRACGVFR